MMPFQLHQQFVSIYRRIRMPRCAILERERKKTMTNTSGNLQEEPNQSRRRFFSWAKQVAAGISLAGLGLGFGLSSPLKTLAASQRPKSGGPYTPDCIQCPYGCIVYTWGNGLHCPEECPYTVYFTQYFGGCEINGHCPNSYNGQTCSNTINTCGCS